MYHHSYDTTILLNRATVIKPNLPSHVPSVIRLSKVWNLREISTTTPSLLPSILLQPTRVNSGTLWVADGFGFLRPSRGKYCRNIAHHRSPLCRLGMEETQISGTPGVMDLRSWCGHTVNKAALLALM